jgi:crossover junction endodeoxyribonuclease RuvC
VIRILGIDPGSRICGYGLIVVRAKSLEYVECGVLTAPEAWPMERRLGEIARSLGEVITELKPSHVAVEDVFSRINARSALALAQARGMALAVVGMAGLSVASYPAPLVKKTVVGRGRAEKAQVARMVQGLLGLAAAPRADAADALAVAITHARVHAPGAARVVPAVVSPRR